MLTSSVISMVVFVHNDLTRREGPHFRRDPTATSKPVWIVWRYRSLKNYTVVVRPYFSLRRSYVSFILGLRYMKKSHHL
jgi:hypothetical protein